MAKWMQPVSRFILTSGDVCILPRILILLVYFASLSFERIDRYALKNMVARLSASGCSHQ